MAAAQVHIKGLRELNRALNMINRQAARGFRRELAQAAEPVAATARSKLSVFQGASVGTIGPRAAMAGVFVTQRARRVTGKRGDFGALQMRRVLVPALHEHADDIVDELDRALDRIAAKAGF